MGSCARHKWVSIRPYKIREFPEDLSSGVPHSYLQVLVECSECGLKAWETYDFIYRRIIKEEK